MRLFFGSVIIVLTFSSIGFSQDPMPVVSFGWHRAIKPAPTPAEQITPARAVTAENKYFQRKAREQLSPGAIDPNETTMDGRSAAMEKAVQQARTAKLEHTNGYTYSTKIRNETGKTVEVIFWEYRFTELARPENTVRRQFLCAVKLKKGESADLSAFSLLGPSEVITADSLADPNGKLFDEKVIVNRFEFADGTLRQRGNWKYEDVKSSVERVTSTPWGMEMCRML
jgi:hypothetical protein